MGKRPESKPTAGFRLHSPSLGLFLLFKQVLCLRGLTRSFVNPTGFLGSGLGGHNQGRGYESGLVGRPGGGEVSEGVHLPPFAFGLGLSGMTDPGKVVEFLDLHAQAAPAEHSVLKQPSDVVLRVFGTLLAYAQKSHEHMPHLWHMLMRNVFQSLF